MLGEEIDGEAAGRIGLADEVTAPGAALDAALALARRFAATAPLPLALSRAVLARGPQPLETVLAQEADGQALLFNSADFAEGRDAFLQKRKPMFTGR
jgi:enoyl-CoA hydratase/carnithine racemase